MPLRLPCPSCGSKLTLDEPFPLPGAMRKCVSCGSGLAISYPAGTYDKLRAMKKRFEGDTPKKPRARPTPVAVPDPGSTAYLADIPIPRAPPPPPPSSSGAASVPPRPAPSSEPAQSEIPATEVVGTEVAKTEVGFEDDVERTVGSARSPYGGLAGNRGEPDAGKPLRMPDLEPARKPVVPSGGGSRAASTGATHYEPDQTETSTVSTKRRAAGCVGGFGSMGCMGVVGVLACGLLAAGFGYWYFSKDLPTVDILQDYVPPTVTTVHAKDGRLLGELYEERRYVLPIEEIPEHVRMAFVSAEDADFYSHGGIDYWGLTRAVGRSISTGTGPRGTSTITQQVAKNFLLTNERSIVRKIKEALLAQRIEGTYDKDHILYLYLNSIYLGSQAYGVEAAARTYFDKGAKDLTHGEAAILAGLPPRPSGYSPHKSWKAARQRQKYVVGQMVAKGHLTQAQGDAALAESIEIKQRGNTFLEQAPHFTEHARRFLVERYGEDKVNHEGLKITTTCDLDLQKVAQNSVTTRIFEVDQRMGFRREGVETVTDIEKKRKELESAMIERQAGIADPAMGRTPAPLKSTLEAGMVTGAVVLEVSKKFVKVGIGSHEGIIPLAWSEWVYKPDPKRSWRYRKQDDLTTKYDYDDDRKKDTAILQKGDVVSIKVEALTVAELTDKKQIRAFKGTPGEGSKLVATRLWQDPIVEGAMLSMDVENGAVRAMVGGANFRDSQFNRALQSKRQVGSTFKPIVYAAAISTKKVTSASMIADAPLAKETGAGFIWKPGNYGNDYLGHITLRKALAMSRNTCTVRVLDAADPGMRKDVIHDFARALGIGGIPSYRMPEDQVTKPSNDQLCPWLVEEPDFKRCDDKWEDPKKPGKFWCRACDMSMALGSPSLTMDEMVRAYSAFATGGKLIEPYFVEEVTDRDGKQLYKHEAPTPPQVIEPALATITTGLMQNVIFGGTAGAATKLKLRGIAGKTGTTNDFKDAWFIGFSNDVITAAWVGFDDPASMGVSSTGGKTALPIWMDYMKEAAPKEKDRAFPMRGGVQSASIDEETGMRVSSGGRTHYFLPGTVPESTGGAAGQVMASDVIDL